MSRNRIAQALIPFLAALAAACAGESLHPCLEGGDPARPAPFRGDKQCTQHKDSSGHYVNHGLYREWHPNGRLALEGRYKMGRKEGMWTEWDPTGRKISEHYYENGVEVMAPAATPPSGPARR